MLSILLLMVKKKKYRRLRPFAGVVSWWKRRHFYVPHDDTFDEEPAITPYYRKSLNASDDTESMTEVEPRESSSHPRFISPIHHPRRFSRSRTTDSIQGSLESMDSLVESYWDPDDDMSQTTTVISNTISPLDFFSQHLTFLTQTQPRQVAEILCGT